MGLDVAMTGIARRLFVGGGGKGLMKGRRSKTRYWVHYTRLMSVHLLLGGICIGIEHGNAVCCVQALFLMTDTDLYLLAFIDVDVRCFGFQRWKLLNATGVLKDCIGRAIYSPTTLGIGVTFQRHRYAVINEGELCLRRSSQTIREKRKRKSKSKTPAIPQRSIFTHKTRKDAFQKFHIPFQSQGTLMPPRHYPPP